MSWKFYDGNGIIQTGSSISGLVQNAFVYAASATTIAGTPAAATNGDLLIGSTGAAPVRAGLTGTANQVTITGGAGSITLSTPQNTHTGANFQVSSLGIGVAASGTAGRLTVNENLLLPTGGVINFGAGNVTATHSAAALAVAGATVTITAPSTTAFALVCDAALNAAEYTQKWTYNGTLGAGVILYSDTSSIAIITRNLGNNVAGCSVQAGRNSSAGAVGPAAGTFLLRQADNTAQYLWADATGTLRINTAAPTGSSGAPTVSDTAGTVVGAQTSSRREKVVVERFVLDAEALAELEGTPLYRFKYKSGAFGGQEFIGILTEDSPTFGMDRDEAHPGGRVFNPITAFGYTVAAIREVSRRLKRLEEQLGSRR